MSILIVDDTAAERLLISAVLKGAGYSDLLTAGSAEEALERLGVAGSSASLAAVDLVLLDLRMPRLDGIEVCRRIKATPSLQDLPVIMVTGSSEDTDLQTAFEAGAMDYITKPPCRVEMLARVRSALRLKHAMDEQKARERDLLDYVEQVGYVTTAAAAVESQTFQPDSLAAVANRSDALGQLARVFQRMAGEIYEREERLQREVRQLRVEIDTTRAARERAERAADDFYRALEAKVRALGAEADIR